MSFFSGWAARARHGRSIGEATAIVVTLAAVIGFFHWTVQSSGGFNPPGEEDYYNFLVRGWQSGHLYLSKAPDPGMLALADPYDPAQNGTFRLGDASYYHGRYYLYFSAVPAVLVMWPYLLVTGRELGTTTTIFLFSVVGFLAASALWLRLRSRYFPASSPWVAPLGLAVLGFASHVLALQRRPLVWELPIVTAYAFSMLALLCADFVIVRVSKIAALATGLCLGLAIAARPTYVVGAVAFLPLAWWAYAREGRAGKTLWCGVAGVALCAAAVLAHNQARFGQLLEFGQNYQLTGIYEAKAAHFSARYVPHNLAIYGFQPPRWTREFPFVSATVERTGPPGYLGEWNEPVAGLALTLPFLALAVFVPWGWQRRAEREAQVVRCELLVIGGFFVGMAGVTLAYFLATPRYMADFTPALALLAAIGALAVERRVAAAGFRPVVLGGIAVVGGLSIAMGALLSFDYHHRMLRGLWPVGWQRLEHFFGSAPPPARPPAQKNPPGKVSRNT